MPNIVGRDAVVHLITEDIYLDLKFTSWNGGHTSPGGGFSYVRSTAPVPEPGSFALLSVGALIFSSHRRRGGKGFSIRQAEAVGSPSRLSPAMTG